MFLATHNFVPLSLLVLLVSEALIIAGCFVAAAFVLRPDPWGYLMERGLINILIASSGILVALYLQGLYTDIRLRSKVLLAQQLALAVGVSLLLESSLNFFSPETMIPRQVMFMGSMLAMSTVLLFRWGYVTQVVKKFPVEKLLFLGRNEQVDEVAARLRERVDLSMQPVGYLSSESGGPTGWMAWLGNLSELGRVVDETHPDRIVLATPLGEALPLRELLVLRMASLRIDELSQIYAGVFRREALPLVRPSTLMLRPEADSIQWLTLASLVGAAVGLGLGLVSMPFWLLIAAGVKLSGGGPVLERNPRLGQYGRRIELLRFRVPERAWGRWMRHWDLQYLPQLWNLVRGDLDLVGPAAETAEEMERWEKEIPLYRQRLLVKPGWTGWAQIQDTGQHPGGKVRQLEYDLYYVRHRTLTLDLYVLLRIHLDS